MSDENEPLPQESPSEPQSAQPAPGASADKPVQQRFANAAEAKAAMDTLLKERWEKKKEGLAPHEAAHAVVADDMGYTVINVNIGRSKDQKASIDWKGLEQQLPHVEWDDSAAVAAIKPKVLDLVTCFVAGHLAEAEGGHSDEKRVSDRTTPELLAAGRRGRADLNATCYFLKLIGCNTQEDVLAAETRAREILARRAGHHKALSEILRENEFVEGKALQTLLGH